MPSTMPQPTVGVQHFFTVDVEEYFQVNAFEQAVPRDRWDALPSRVERSIDVLLDMLAAHGAHATFFTLGWIASRHPQVVRRIAAAGHEIASHGWWHRKVTSLSEDAFREDVRTSKEILEDVSGQRVSGFRAPSFSIIPGGEWAFDVLLEEGYDYDSSLFPVRRNGYGYATALPRAHVINRPAGQLMQFPLATTVLSGVRVPAAGGGYLRHFPYAVIRRAFDEHTRDGVPAVFYIHPWEVDAEQPRMDVGLLTKMRHYRGLDRTRPRMERLLSEFRFTSIRRSMVAGTPSTLGTYTLPVAKIGRAAAATA